MSFGLNIFPDVDLKEPRIKKVYIYCTKPAHYLFLDSDGDHIYDYPNKRAVEDSTIAPTMSLLNGYVCLTANCKTALCFHYGHITADGFNYVTARSCLTKDALLDYVKGKDFYAYLFFDVKHIAPLKISHFFTNRSGTVHLCKAPQSYCFAYEDDGHGGFERVLIFSIKSYFVYCFAYYYKTFEIRTTHIRNAGISYANGDYDF